MMKELFVANHLNIKGVLHVGGYNRQEAAEYAKQKLSWVLWVEPTVNGVSQTRDELRHYGFHNQMVYPEPIVVAEWDNKEISYNIYNNQQLSSQLLPGKDLSKYYPGAVPATCPPVHTLKADTLIVRGGKTPADCNLLVLNVNGTELSALKGATHLLDSIQYIYIKTTSADLFANGAKQTDIDAYLTKIGFVVGNSQAVPNTSIIYVLYQKSGAPAPTPVPAPTPTPAPTPVQPADFVDVNTTQPKKQ